MKKEINFEFDGNKYKVDVESDGENLVITKDGKTYKKISFPPNEGMKGVEMEPAYGTYN